MGLEGHGKEESRLAGLGSREGSSWSQLAPSPHDKTFLGSRGKAMEIYTDRVS